jgi:hypothetical protein
LLHVTDRRDLASTAPQHPVVEAEPRKHASKAAVPGVARRASPGPPHRRASGRPLPRLSGLYKAPPSTRSNSPHSQLAPRQPRFSPLALARRSQPRRRGTGRGRRHRLRPPLELLLVRGGGAEPPPSICYPAVKLCYLSVTPSPSNTRHCNAGELLP